MPTSSGPNTLRESNLVFAYDTGDVKNSYRGQPTVNLWNFSNADRCWSSLSSNACSLRTNTGNNSFTMIGTCNTPGGQAFVYPYLSTTNIIHTLACTIKNNDNRTVSVTLFIRDGDNGTTLAQQDFNILPNTAQRISITSTAITSNSATPAIYPQTNTSDGYINIQVTDIQFEAKSNPTQFVAGTRSVTQGLLDLTGYRTINLTNASFNSNAQMTFDGTNDYIETSAIILTSDFTISQVVTLQGTKNEQMPIGGGLATNGSTYQAYVWFRKTTNQIVVAFNGEIQLLFTVSPTLWTDKTIMYNVTKSGSIVTLYINGVVISSNTISPTDQFTIRTIGYSWSSSYSCLGNVDNTFIYNRALSTGEVKHNYQQYKTRFNLS
jgi:hypothetical protein